MTRVGAHRAPVAVAVVLTFLICALPIRAAGASPLEAYKRYLFTPLTSLHGIQEVLLAATPLLFTGLAVAVAFRAGYFNIGAEGQFLAGAMGAAVPGLYLDGLPAGVALPAGDAGRRARRGALGAAAGLAQAAGGHRRGGHHAAAQPGCPAAPAGAPQRTVAEPGQRVPRLREFRARLRDADAVRQRARTRRLPHRRRGNCPHRRGDDVHAARSAHQGGRSVARCGAVLGHPRRAHPVVVGAHVGRHRRSRRRGAGARRAAPGHAIDRHRLRLHRHRRRHPRRADRRRGARRRVAARRHHRRRPERVVRAPAAHADGSARHRRYCC